MNWCTFSVYSYPSLLIWIPFTLNFQPILCYIHILHKTSSMQAGRSLSFISRCKFTNQWEAYTITMKFICRVQSNTNYFMHWQAQIFSDLVIYLPMYMCIVLLKQSMNHNFSTCIEHIVLFSSGWLCNPCLHYSLRCTCTIIIGYNYVRFFRIT